MNIERVLPLDILTEIALLIEEYRDYSSFITTCKTINSVDKDVRRRQTIRETFTSLKPINRSDRGYMEISTDRTIFKGVIHGYEYTYCEDWIITEGQYINGIKNGQFTEYFPPNDDEDGYCHDLKILSHYVRGKLHGMYREWWMTENNSPIMMIDSEYKNGELDGICQYRDLDDPMVPMTLYKYEDGLCIDTSEERWKCEMFGWLNYHFRNATFDYCISNFVYDFCFENDGIRWLVDIDEEFDENDKKNEDILSYIREKVIVAVEYGYNIIRIFSKYSDNTGKFLSEIDRIVHDSDRDLPRLEPSNPDNNISDITIIADNSNFTTDICPFISRGRIYPFYLNTHMTHMDMDIYDFVFRDDHTTDWKKYTNNPRLHTSHYTHGNTTEVNDMWWEDRIKERLNLGYDNLCPNAKDLFDKHMKYGYDMINTFTIGEKLIRELTEKKGFYRFESIHFLTETNRSIFYSLFYFMGKKDWSDINEDITDRMKRLFIHELGSHTEKCKKCNHKDDRDPNLVVNQYRQLGDMVMKLYFGDYYMYRCSDKWKLSNEIELNEHDISLILEYVNMYSSLLDKYKEAMKGIDNDKWQNYSVKLAKTFGKAAKRIKCT